MPDKDNIVLKPVAKKFPEQFLKKRSCGHNYGFTLDEIVWKEDGTAIVTSYCAGCLVEKLGLQPVSQHELKDGKAYKIWGE